MSSNNTNASNLTDILTRVASATTTSTTLPHGPGYEKMTILKALIGQNRTIMQLRQRILSRLLFPDFYNDEGGNAGVSSVDSSSSLDYKLGQEYEETSRFLDSLSGSGIPNKTVLFTSDDYSASSSISDYDSASLASQMLNETGSDYDSGYLGQMSTPFMYILFMFVVYIVIIAVIFMSAVYSHRKRVGYNYDGDEEELIGSEHTKSQASSIHDESEQRTAPPDDDSDSDSAAPLSRSRCKRNQESNNNLAYSGDSSSSSDESSDLEKAYVKTNRAKNISYLENMFKLLADVNIDELKRSIRSSKLISRKTRNSRAIVKESDKSPDIDEQDESKDKIEQSSCASVLDTSQPLLKKRDDNDEDDHDDQTF